METYTYSAPDGIEIYVYKWLPAGEPKAAFQLVHGSIEHASRYTHFAERLASEGYAVYAPDLRGHGKTGAESGQPELFSKQSNGWQLTLDDLRKLTEQIQAEHPGLPVFVFGHSMGSFLVRDYITQNGNAFSGAILSGTGSAAPALTYVGLILAKLFKLTGRNKRSPFLHNLAYGTLNDKIENPRTDYDFLSRDPALVDAYIADPWCGQTITAEYGHELISGLLRINNPQAYQQAPKDLPLYLFSGEKDPVGGEDASYVNEVADLYRQAGVNDVSVKIYPGARHETLNETNKEDVIDDVIAWLNARVKK